MRPLRYSINVTLDGCCDHRAMFADEDLHRHAVENLNRADALLFGRVTYVASAVCRASCVVMAIRCRSGVSVNQALRAELIQMDERDQAVRAELAADGSLYEGYHPRMAAVHDSNAARLKAIIAESGWPTERLVGADGARAAHRIAQHAINRPAFMGECRKLLDEASARGEVPRSYFVYIDDRIRVYEGLPQRYGTQWRGCPNGLEPYPIEDSAHVDERRAELGLPSLAALRASAPPARPWDPQPAQRYEEQELAWRRAVGWIP